MQIRRIGQELRLIVTQADAAPLHNLPLIRLVQRGLMLREEMLRDRLTIAALAKKHGLAGSYLTRVLRVGFLAPNIIDAIAEGRQPGELTANRLLRDSKLPLSWAEQKSACGF